jgi:hypothetical protein
MLIQNNKQSFVNVVEQFSVSKPLQFWITIMEGLWFKT